MAKRAKITPQGLALLASSSESTGQYYWIGYYALAYVPNAWKNTDTDINTVNEPTIDGSTINELTTRLTTHGDIIYNIWQGDLTGTGYANGESDGSASGDLFGLTMYDVNIKKHYRYVIDADGKNNLVSWITDSSKTDGSMKGMHIYEGAHTEDNTEIISESEIPIPAPLYYLGDTSDKLNVIDYFDDSPTFEDTSYNGSDIYPYIKNVSMSSGSKLDILRVSTDFRGYAASSNAGTLGTDRSSFDSNEIAGASTSTANQWFSSLSTYMYNDEETYICDEFWKLHTISNYNRYHAPASSVGGILYSDLYNKNISKATKFFPISNYKVINTETKFTSNSEEIEVATAIRIGIDIDLSPNTLASGFDADDPTVLDQSSSEEFLDAYENAAIDSESDTKDQFDESIYVSTHCSFKFNRIGIYAVPMRTSAYYSDDGFGVDEDKPKHLQFQINPDEEPVLFAVVDWDNTITLSDTGDGIHEFAADLDVNIKSTTDDDEDSAIINQAAIFYNLYEDDAQTWYQHQLIANASSANAVTELMLELNHLKKRLQSSQSSGSGNCCPTPDLSKLYAPLNHSHKMLQNLKDSTVVSDGGLRGIDSVQEGVIINGSKYSLGDDAVSLGLNSYVISDYSTVAGGVSNYIGASSKEAFIGSGSGNNIHDESANSSIINGISNELSYSVSSLIGSGNSNVLLRVDNSVICGGLLNKIYNDLTTVSSLYIRDFIGCGNTNTILDCKYSSILNGEFNNISKSNYAAILNGMHNGISLASHNSVIGGEYNNINASTNSVICSGVKSSIVASINSFIGAGNELQILDASYGSVLCGGYKNRIKEKSPEAFIGGGLENTVSGTISAIVSGYLNSVSGTLSFIGIGKNNSVESNSSIVLGGYGNTIEYDGSTDVYSIICSGITNTETNSVYAFIGTGITNVISDSQYAVVLNGHNNKIISSVNSIILGGGINVVEEHDSVCVFGNNITATRDDAFFVNSLSLYDSTIELVSKTPSVNDVLRVSSVDGNVATVEWGNMNPTFNDHHTITLDSDNVASGAYTLSLTDGDTYSLTLKTAVAITLDDTNLSVGASVIIRVISVSEDSSFIFSGDNGTEEFGSTISLSSSSAYAFLIVNTYKTTRNHLTFIGNY